MTDGRTDGRTGHFVLPDLPEYTTTRGTSGPKIKNLVPRQYSTYFTWTLVITTVCGCVRVRDYTIQYVFISTAFYDFGHFFLNKEGENVLVSCLIWREKTKNCGKFSTDLTVQDVESFRYTTEQ